VRIQYDSITGEATTGRWAVKRLGIIFLGKACSERVGYRITIRRGSKAGPWERGQQSAQKKGRTDRKSAADVQVRTARDGKGEPRRKKVAIRVSGVWALGVQLNMHTSFENRVVRIGRDDFDVSLPMEKKLKGSGSKRRGDPEPSLELRVRAVDWSNSREGRQRPCQRWGGGAHRSFLQKREKKVGVNGKGRPYQQGNEGGEDQKPKICTSPVEQD